MIPLKDDNLTSTYPFVTLLLIVINGLVFVYQWALPAEAEWLFLHKYGLIPVVLTRFTDPFPQDGWPVALTLLSSFFLHGGFLHLTINMLYLWVFGSSIEDVLGHVRFIFFYLICGLGANLFFLVTESGAHVPLVGASGAVAGVMGAYLLHFPRARIQTLILIIIYPLLLWIPAVILLAFWLVLQFLNASAPGQSGVAWTAHIGGFFCGLLTIRLMNKKLSPRGVPRSGRSASRTRKTYYL